MCLRFESKLKKGLCARTDPRTHAHSQTVFKDVIFRSGTLGLDLAGGASDGHMAVLDSALTAEVKFVVHCECRRKGEHASPYIGACPCVCSLASLLIKPGLLWFASILVGATCQH